MSFTRPLDAVDWSGLAGPHGPCSELPALLERLAHRRTDDDAWDVFHSITHQGTVYPVTPVALPYVLDLIAAEPNRVLLVTVYEALTGRGWWQVRDGRGGRAAPEGALAQEDRTEQAINEAVVQRRPLLEMLAQHESRSVRLNVVPILARLDGPWLADGMSREPDSTVRAAANLALRAAGAPELVGMEATSDIERLSVALAHPDEHPDILLSALGDSTLDEQRPQDWPLDITLQYEAAGALAQCRDATVFDQLIEWFPGYHWTVSVEAGEALLALSARHGQLGRAVEMLADSNSFWVDSMQLVRALALQPYGLPNDRDELRLWTEEGG